MRFVFYSFFAVFSIFIGNLFSATATWNLNANGNWNVNGNWNPATFPNAIDDIANFLTIITANRTITLGQNITVGTVNIDDNNNYIISSGVNSLTFQTSAGNAALNITNANGSGLHTISSAVVLNSNLVLTNSSTSVFTMSGAISGANALTKLGSGQLTFSGGGANTYTGLTTVTAGTLALSKTAGVTAIAGNALINGGTLSLTSANHIADTSTVTLNSGTFNMGAAETINSLIFNGGAFSGASTLTLAGTAAGTLSMGNGVNLSVPTTFSSTGGLTYTGTTTGSTISGALNLGSALAHTFNINDGAAAVDFNITSVISGANATVTMSTGNGTLSYSGTSSNTYSGLTTINAGELILNKTSGLNALAGNVTVNGGTLTLGTTNQIINSATVTLTSGTFNMNGNAETISSLVFNGGTLSQGGAAITLAGTAATTLSMGNGVTISGPLAFSSTGGFTYTGTTTQAIISGNMSLGTVAHTFNIANGAAAVDVDISGVISGTGGAITKSTGIGSLQFSGSSPNTYTGVTTVTAGELILNKSGGTAAIVGNTTINGGTVTLGATDQFGSTSNVTLSSGTFNMAGNATTLNAFTFTGGTFTQGGGILSLSSNVTALTVGGVTISGNVNLTGSGAVSFNGSATAATISGNLDLGSSDHTFSITNGAATPDMVISGVISGTGGLTKTVNTSVLQFSGSNPNTYTGLTTITQGTLSLNKTVGVNAIAGNILVPAGTLTLAAANQIADTSLMTLSGGTFNMGGNAETIAQLTFNSGTLTQGGGTLSLASGTTALTMRNTTISGPIALTGGGTVVFDNTNNGTATLSSTINLGGSDIFFDITNGTAASDMTVSGTISNGGVSKLGSGQLTFSGGGANTYTGLTTVTAGTLALSKTAGITAIAGNALINGGTLSLTSANQIANTSTVTLSSGTFNMGAAETIDSLIFNGGSFSGASTLTLAGVAAETLSMGNGVNLSVPTTFSSTGGLTYTGTTTGSTISGALNLGAALAHTFNINDGAAAVDLDITSVISGVNATVTMSTGGGTLRYSGTSSNTYSGLTTINAGELVLNKTAGLNALAGNVTINGGTLTLGTTNQIINSATATLISGTFNMNGNDESINSLVFNGGTLSQGGATLSLLNAVTALTMRDVTITGSINVAAGGAIAFDNTNNGTATISGEVILVSPTNFNIADGTSLIDMQVTGVISGGTSLTKIGAGTLLLTGTNTYSGGTTINDGILQGDTNGLQGNIANESALIFDQSLTGTYAGTMSGAVGTFTKQGIGLLNLSGNNSVGGLSTISQGSLAINGTLSGAGALTVASGGTLQGTGTISKNVTVFGTLSPGNSIGTINLVGNQILATGSTLNIELNPSQISLVNITGNLTIQPGATVNFVPQPGNYEDFFQLQFIQTTTGVSGTFSAQTSTLPLFNGTIIYTATGVFVQNGFLPIADIIGSGNAGAIADCLKKLPKIPGTDLAFVVNELRMIPTVEGLQDALLQMQPSSFTSLSIIQENNALYLKNIVLFQLDQRLHSCLSNAKNQWHLWGVPILAFTSQENIKEEPGFHAHSVGGIVGLDVIPTSQSQYGGALGYINNDFDWRKSRGNASTDAVYGIFYGKWDLSKLYFTGALLGGWNHYSINRKINFKGFIGIDRIAKSKHNGASGSIDLKGALKVLTRKALFMPYIDINYFLLYQNSFQESGANSLNLSLKSYYADLLSTEAGIEVSNCFTHRNIVSINPFFQLGLIRESRFQGKKVKADFNGCPLVVIGISPSRTLFTALAGIDFTFNKRLSSLSIFYKGKYNSSYYDNSFYFDLSLAF